MFVWAKYRSIHSFSRLQYVALAIFFYLADIWWECSISKRILYCPRLLLSINIFSIEPNKMLELHFSVVFFILFHFSEYSIYFWGWFDSISLMYKMLLLWWCSETLFFFFISDKKDQLHFKEFRCGTPKANFHVQCGHFCGFLLSQNIFLEIQNFLFKI